VDALAEQRPNAEHLTAPQLFAVTRIRTRKWSRMLVDARERQARMKT